MLTETTVKIPVPEADEAFIRKALDEADLNAVRLCLYQITGDEHFAKMKLVSTPMWGGIFQASALAREHHEEVKRRAFELLSDLPIATPPLPSLEKRRELMESYTNVPLSENEFLVGNEELALDEFPRGVEWSTPQSPEKLARYHVIIVGAGISGIALAVLLQRLGIPYTIFEKERGPGGTWLINDFPECRVDVDAALYQFKFEKNFRWTERYPTGPETRRYLEYIIGKYGIAPHIRYSTLVATADWNEDQSKWDVGVKGPDGKTEQVSANFVINATGVFAKIRMPDIPGIDDFAGALFHSARWDHSVDYAGKRVAVIGNGATGGQLLKGIAQKAGHAEIYIRTPEWIVPIAEYHSAISPEKQWLFDNLPFYWNWYCYSIYVSSYEFQRLTVYDREWQKKGGLINERNDRLRQMLTEYIVKQYGGDEEAARQMVPPFPPLARRMVTENGWFDTLKRDNVSVVRTPIERFVPEGIKTTDGVVHPLDVVVACTGFNVDDYTWPIEYRGRNGLTLQEAWAEDGPRAYLSMALPKFPNFFMFYGPNGQPRTGGFYTLAEMWSRYAAKIMISMIEKDLKAIEVTPEAFEDYNDRIDIAAKDNIRGPESAGSYYMNRWGRAGINMPFSAEDYAAMLRDPNYDDFIVE